MNSMFLETVDAMGEGFLLGSDHYYTLHHGWAQNNPTPRYALRVFLSNELMRLMGMPPTVLEMPGGSPSDTPPILKEDLQACYFANLAMGLKGVNFYIYTGGPNVPGTGETCDLYDYNALVRANGEKNATFAALEAFGGFMKENGWMQRASLAASVQVGFEWAATRAAGLDYSGQKLSLSQSWDFLQHGILYGLFCSGHRPKLQPLDRPLDKTMPLLVPGASAMSRQAQRNIIDFVKDGGHAILIGALPETDLDYAPCTLLKEFCGDPQPVAVTTPALVVDAPEFGATIYNTSPVSGVAEIPQGAKLLARDTRRGAAMGYRLQKGSGSITWLGLQFMIRTFDQVQWLEQLLEIAGAKPLILSSNRNVMTTLWEGDGRKCLFVMNLYASPQSTELTLYPGSDREQALGRIDLAAMEVKVLDI
jgi:beta-galactosidase